MTGIKLAHIHTHACSGLSVWLDQNTISEHCGGEVRAWYQVWDRLYLWGIISHISLCTNICSLHLSLSLNETLLGNHISASLSCLAEISKGSVSMTAVDLQGYSLAVRSVSNVSPVQRIWCNTSSSRWHCTDGIPHCHFLLGFSLALLTHCELSPAGYMSLVTCQYRMRILWGIETQMVCSNYAQFQLSRALVTLLCLMAFLFCTWLCLWG